MSKNLKSWVLLLILACIWGSSFMLMKKGMFTENGEKIFSALQVGNLRMLIASSILLPLSLFNLKKIKNKKQLLYLCIVGFCGNFFPAFLFTYAETEVSSGFAGMLNSFTPIFTLVLGFLLFSNRMTKFQVIGTIIGTIGIYFLITTGKNASFKGDWSHIFAIIIATFLYGLSLNTIKYKLQEFSASEITSLGFLLVFLPSLFGFFFLNTATVFLESSEAMNGFSAIAILAIVGTALAVFLFNGIIRVSSALFASGVTYFIPIVAVIIGFYYGETISNWQILAMFIVLIGVVLANYGAKLFSRSKKT
jgi:drug/metabolite transporter (DMT)-like permease